MKAVYALPETIKLWPSVGLAALLHKGGGGAFRLFLLARALDPDGSGHVHNSKLKIGALSLGLSPRSFYSWYRQAITLGIFKELPKGIIRLSREAEVMKILHVFFVDGERVEVELKSLFAKGWRSILWAAFIRANFNGQIVSKKVLSALTGISENHQKKINNLVKRTRQFKVTNKSPDQLAAANEFSTPGKSFVFTDPQTKEKVIAEHLPSKQEVSDTTAKSGGRGRRQAILEELTRGGTTARKNSQLFNSRAENPVITRLFYSSEKQLKAAALISQSFSRLPNDPREIFVERPNGRGGRCLWDALPVGTRK